MARLRHGVLPGLGQVLRDRVDKRVRLRLLQRPGGLHQLRLRRVHLVEHHARVHAGYAVEARVARLDVGAIGEVRLEPNSRLRLVKAATTDHRGPAPDRPATATGVGAPAGTDGLSLVPYTGSDAGQMTVGGELNKLAGNIALFRDAAGVHWRSDYTESLPLGEAIAIGLLQEMSLGFNEDDAFFELTRFDGQRIRIFDGKVEPVVA